MPFKPPSAKQKKKLSKFLSEGEKVVLVTTIGKRYFLIKLTFLLFLPLLLVLITTLMISEVIIVKGYQWLQFLGIFPAIFLLIKSFKVSQLMRMRQSYIYALTNRRFVIIRGIFSRKIVTAPLDRITHITVEQSLSQRYLYNTGNLVIITAGFDQREIVIEHVANPVGFKILVEELTEKLSNSDKSEDFSLRQLNS